MNREENGFPESGETLHMRTQLKPALFLFSVAYMATGEPGNA